jgi:transposase-like protein
MGKRRRKLDASLKATVAREALREQRTVAQIASQYEVHATQVSTWKREALAKLPTLFGSKSSGQASADTRKEAELYEQIGRLKMELEWLKKKSSRLDS